MNLIEAVKSGKDIRVKYGQSYSDWLYLAHSYFYERSTGSRHNFTVHEIVLETWEVKE
jgi:hypothetical protein